jgi:hypothetical protein
MLHRRERQGTEKPYREGRQGREEIHSLTAKDAKDAKGTSIKAKPQGREDNAK